MDPDYDEQEEGKERADEPMDAENEEEAAMKAMMGFGGFGTTKVCRYSSVCPCFDVD